MIHRYSIRLLGYFILAPQPKHIQEMIRKKTKLTKLLVFSSDIFFLMIFWLLNGGIFHVGFGITSEPRVLMPLMPTFWQGPFSSQQMALWPGSEITHGDVMEFFSWKIHVAIRFMMTLKLKQMTLRTDDRLISLICLICLIWGPIDLIDLAAFGLPSFLV